MPVWNRAHRVGQAMESVLGQTFTDFELIIIDDGSEDGLEEAVRRFSSPRVRRVRIPHSGVAVARNAGIADSIGQFIAYLDSDNTWRPGFLQRMKEALDQDPEKRQVAYALAEEQQRHAAEPVPAAETFQDLAGDLTRMWDDPATEMSLKKRIVRTLIQEIVADVDAKAHEIVLLIHWQGGLHTELRVPKPRHGQNRLHTAPEIVEVVRLLARICRDQHITGLLNRHGLRTGRGNRWTLERVVALRSHHQIPVYSPPARQAQGWMNLSEAAALIGVSPKTLRRAAEAGHVEGLHPLPDGPWIFQRTELLQPKVQRLVARAHAHQHLPAGPDPQQLSLELTST